MSKIIIILCILFAMQSLLMGQQLRTEKVGDNTNLVLLLPYSGFHPNLKTHICDYDLNVDVLTSNDKNVYHDLIHIEFAQPDSFQAEVYPFFFHRNLQPGKYILYMKLVNRDLGDKTSRNFLLK